MSIRYFITGTDTEVGKTYVSVGMLKAFNQLKLKTLGLKPIASGIEDGASHPSDTIQLQNAASMKLPLEQITPFAFHPAIAPHIAAQKINRELNLCTLNEAYQQTLTLPADICIIEGFGGWYAPLNDVETMADFVKYHMFNVILVVGIRLGCLNHAILTQQAIQRSGVKLVGWVANCIHPEMPSIHENISTLKKHLTSPYLGTVEHNLSPEDYLKVFNQMLG